MKKRADIFQDRQKRLTVLLEKERVPALLVSNLINVRYLTGFACTYGSLLAVGGRFFFLTDSRYIFEARKKAVADEIEETKSERAPEVIREILGGAKARKLCFEPEALSYADYEKLSESARGVKLAPHSGAVESVRTVKDGSEVAAIKRASAVMSRALRDALAETAPGSTEKDIRASLESRMIMSGAEGIAFDTIAASGPRSAYAHGAPTDRRIATGDFVVIDFGARVDGYNSDMTRTAHVGRPSADDARMYRAVLEARNSAVEAAVPGAPGEAPDRAARVALRKYGLDQHFTHGLGHGVGLEVHERPRLAPGAKEKLVPGMVFTIEPGVYIKGRGGVRIEDTFLQTKDGPVPLTSGSRLMRVI